VASIREADDKRQQEIISLILKKTRGPFQDALALLVGMVSFRFSVVKDGAGRRVGKNIRKTIRMLDRVSGG